MLQACLNGARGHDYSAAVPLTPEALARDAAACLAAGANEFHVHPRDAGGQESFAAEDIGAALKAIRTGVPGVADTGGNHGRCRRAPAGVSGVAGFAKLCVGQS